MKTLHLNESACLLFFRAIGASLLEPVEIRNTSIRFKPQKPVKEIMLMRSGTSINFKAENGWVECVVPSVKDFEMLDCLNK